MANNTRYKTLMFTTDKKLVELDDIEKYAFYTVLSVLSTPKYSIPENPGFGTRYWYFKHRLSTKIDKAEIEAMIQEDLDENVPSALLDLVNIEIKDISIDKQQNLITISLEISLKSGKRIHLTL